MKSTSRLTSRDFLKSQTVMKKRRKKRLFKFYSISILGVLLVSGLAYASHMERIQIKKVVVVGNNTVSGEEVEKVSNLILDASYMGMFPKRNSLIFPKDQIERKLIETFPKIESLDMETESFGFLNVRIKERTPSVEWCTALECYLVDANSYIFGNSATEAPDLKAGLAKDTEEFSKKADKNEGDEVGELEIPLSQGASVVSALFSPSIANASSSDSTSAASSSENISADESVSKKASERPVEKNVPGTLLKITGLDEIVGVKPVGKTLMPVDLLKQIKDIATDLEKYNLKVREVEYRSEDEIVFKIYNNGRIIFNQRRPLQESYENLVTALKSDVFTPGPTVFEYIDTRFGNKVFYKLRK